MAREHRRLCKDLSKQQINKMRQPLAASPLHGVRAAKDATDSDQMLPVCTF